MNIEPCYNHFEASQHAGANRVMFASLNRAAGVHRHDQLILNAAASSLRTAQPSRHDATGEALHRMTGYNFVILHGVSGDVHSRWNKT
ncbi:hypothetical protein PQQ53_15385 [Paraburkholderia strydomiana]|uniref:hypothetical protein n=1 Tax=Paraburkholderia strydomiana TaxID=1245417 RepID=UPI0038B9CE26